MNEILNLLTMYNNRGRKISVRLVATLESRLETGLSLICPSSRRINTFSKHFCRVFVGFLGQRTENRQKIRENSQTEDCTEDQTKQKRKDYRAETASSYSLVFVSTMVGSLSVLK